MRTCSNPACPAFGRIFYSLSTRCPFCKWDLKATARILPAATRRVRGRRTNSR